MNAISRKRTIAAVIVCVAVAISGCASESVAPSVGTQVTNPMPLDLQLLVPCDRALDGASADATPFPILAPRIANVGGLPPITYGGDYLYIADEYNSQIDVFHLRGREQTPIGSISSGVAEPYGIWYDRGTKSLYVANQTNSTVTAYPYGTQTPSVTYSQDLSRPLYPVVDRHGDLFVSNANTGAVVEYLAGSTNPHMVLQTPGVEADGLAFDRHGNLYVAYRTCPSGSGSVERFAPGSDKGQVLGMTLSDPQGLVIDASGDVVVDETGTANARLHQVDVFPPGSKTASVQVQIPPSDIPAELVLSQHEMYLDIVDQAGTIYEARYPLSSQTTLYIKDQISAVIQGAASTNDVDF